jgi:hypothetical protein
LADQLRSDSRSMLQARRAPSSTGGMVVAPTALGALGSLADQYRAYKLDEGAKETRGKVNKDREDAGKSLFEAMRRSGGAAITSGG